MVKDLQADNNRLHRIIKKFSTEAEAVSIARTAMYLVAVFGVLVLLAVYASIKAEVRSEQQDKDIVQLTDRVDVLTNKVTRLQSWLIAHGVPIEEIYDE